jgi:hypothetical protein
MEAEDHGLKVTKLDSYKMFMLIDSNVVPAL